MERAPKPVGSCSLPEPGSLGLLSEWSSELSPSAVSASGKAITAIMTAPQEAPSAPAHNFIYRMAVLGSFLLPDTLPTLECLALFLPGDGMILMFANSCHGEGCVAAAAVATK